MDMIHVSQILFLFWQLQCDFPWDFTILAALALYRQGEGRPSQEVRLSKCQQKCQHVTPRYFGQQVWYKSIRQIQRPAKSLATISLFSISPIQIFNDQLELAEWCFSKQNAHSSMRSFNISNEFILSVIRNKFIAEKGALMLCEKCTNRSGQPRNQEHAILNYRGIT